MTSIDKFYQEGFKKPNQANIDQNQKGCTLNLNYLTVAQLQTIIEYKTAKESS